MNRVAWIAVWLFLLAVAAIPAPAAPPAPGIVLPIVYPGDAVIDGDTCDVLVTVRIRVRLLAGDKGCWSPEKNTDEGKAAKHSMKMLTAGEGGSLATGIIAIPIKSIDLQELFTFGRVLANCYVEGSDKSLGEQQIALGHASSRKGGRLGE